MQHDKILILDFGSQVTQLIARRVREAHVYSEVHPCDVSDAWIREYAADGRLKGVILSGSHASVYEDTTDKAPQAVFELGVPVLGICYGMQTMAHQLGGKVEGGHKREFGFAAVRARGHTELLRDIADFTTPEGHGMLNVWMSHGDKVVEMPPGFKLMASTESCPIAGMADEARRFYAIQFHAEVTHTVQGRAILERFVLGICKAEPGLGDARPHRRSRGRHPPAGRRRGGDPGPVGRRRFLGGRGADPPRHRRPAHLRVRRPRPAAPERGRHGDGHVRRQAARQGRARGRRRPVPGQAGRREPTPRPSARSSAACSSTSSRPRPPKIKQTHSRHVAWLAQGTIYPDVIESGGGKSKKAVTIKSHHNVGGLPEQLGLKLLEPLRDLFKDEVRELGVALGLPPEMVYRHPFPGPGPGRAHPGRGEEGVRRPAAPRRRHLHPGTAQLPRPHTGKSWYDLTSQAFTVFLPVKSVGVMGDGRTYDYVVALRAVQTSDFMTADWAELPYALLKKVSSRIINEVRGINRVTYDVSSKPPATIEWE
jgi:GMP synthase (glutamine-hydrolysing)